MSNYDAKSCSALAKLHYRPVDAALRWCGLIDHEVKILTATGEAQYPPLGTFPQWPCLRSNIEAILDAIENGDLPHGRDGKTVVFGEHVAVARRTIRHSDLKTWMTKHHPDKTPAFLFDDIERTTHASINADTFRALQADRDALKLRVEKGTDLYRALKKDRDAIAGERDSLLEAGKKLTERERSTLLVIIGALCKEAKLDYTKHSKAAGLIQGTAIGMGVLISETTIENHLKKVAEALGSRAA